MRVNCGLRCRKNTTQARKTFNKEQDFKNIEMRIAIYTISAYPHLGGMTSHMQELKSGLEAIGNEVHAFGFPLTAVIKAPRKAYHRTKDELTKTKGFHTISGVFYISRALFFIAVMNVYLVFQQLTKHFDAYMSQDAVAYHSSFLIRKLFRKKVTLTVHGYYVDEKIADNKIPNKGLLTEQLYRIERSAYKSAPIIFSVDTRIKDYIKKILKSDEKITVLKNFVNTDFFKPMKLKKENKFTILCPRRLVEKNGVIYAVKAMQYLPKDCQLLIAGEGQTLSDIEREIKENNLKNVKILGGLPRSKMPELINKSHAVVIPSISIKGVEEATSISALEAMSCGVPVISSNIGGLKEIVINNKTGILVKDKEPKEIAKAAEKLRKNESLQKELGRNARALILEDYSHIKKAKAYLTKLRS